MRSGLKPPPTSSTNPRPLTFSIAPKKSHVENPIEGRLWTPPHGPTAQSDRKSKSTTTDFF